MTFTFLHSPVAHRIQTASKNLSDLKISHSPHIVQNVCRKLKPNSSRCHPRSS